MIDHTYKFLGIQYSYQFEKLNDNQLKIYYEVLLTKGISLSKEYYIHTKHIHIEDKNNNSLQVFISSILFVIGMIISTLFLLLSILTYDVEIISVGMYIFIFILATFLYYKFLIKEYLKISDNTGCSIKIKYMDNDKKHELISLINESEIPI